MRADIRNPMIGRVIESTGVDTVVHMNVIATPTFVGGRTPQKEINVIGTMQLLAACQKSSTVRRLVVKSSAAVYGSTPRDPAMFTEDMSAKRSPSGGFGKDSIEVEGYVRGFARRRPDTEILTLRFANIIGPRIRTSITDYFNLPVIPAPLGFDARHAVHARGRRHRARSCWPPPATPPGSSTSPATGWSPCSRRRRSSAARWCRCRCRPPGSSAGSPAGWAWPTSRPTRCRSSPSAAASTPPGCATVLGFEPRFTSRGAFEDFARTVGPAVPAAAASSGDAVSGVAGTATQAVLRTLGTGRGR